ncbi:hypothetical protein WJX73_000356 [Symbiochloris irregularis]|uniref:Uncharacterized protein n=1 Tax=Symbiochloris irregularis TaxID=706552 RepID=A0AAW1PQF3_9CHLO
MQASATALAASPGCLNKPCLHGRRRSVGATVQAFRTDDRSAAPAWLPHASLVQTPASASGIQAMTLPRTPPEWQPPSRPESDPSSTPPEFTPPREPGQIPGTVPEYEPPATPGPTPPRPTDPPTRPLRPGEDPQIPDPQRDDPLRNPEKRREETNNPPAVRPGRVMPPENAMRPTAGPASTGQAASAYDQPPSKAADRIAPLGESSQASATQRPLAPETNAAASSNGQQQPWVAPTPPLYQDQVQDWNDKYSIKDRLYFEHPTARATPWAVLQDINGHLVHISMHGANIVSWINGNEEAMLHVRRDDFLDSPTFEPILGGIQAMFPQVGKAEGLVKRAGGALPRVPTDGFLSDLTFEPVHTSFTGSWTSISLRASSTPETLAIYPHPFEVLYTVSLSSLEGEDPTTTLRCVLQILNTGDTDMTFTAALQPSFEITSPEDTQILGLGGRYFIDTYEPEPVLGMFAPQPLQLGEDTLEFVVTDAAVDSDIALHTGSDEDSALVLRTAKGFKDLGIWHPFGLYGAPDGFAEDFVCLGPTTIARPVILKAGAKWAGEMSIVERQRVTEEQREALLEQAGDDESEESAEEEVDAASVGSEGPAEEEAPRQKSRYFQDGRKVQQYKAFEKS